jgi:tetratricopeptide (TPR) repeat protein
VARQSQSILDHALASSHFPPIAVALLVALPLCWGCGVASNNLNASGTRYFQRGDNAKALQKFEEAVAVNPNDADSYYNLGAYYHHLARQTGDQTDAAQAEGYYNQCLDIYPDHVECYRGLAVLLVQQDRENQAFRLLEGWKQRSPQLVTPNVALAQLHGEAGNSKASKEHLLDAIAKDTTHPHARAALGKLHEEKGDYKQALANYHMALARNGAQPHLHAKVASLKGDTDGSPLLTSAPLTEVVTAPSSNLRY